jgi:hypothetical protein
MGKAEEGWVWGMEAGFGGRKGVSLSVLHQTDGKAALNFPKNK